MSSNSTNKPDVYEKQSRREARDRAHRRFLAEQALKSAHRQVVVLGDQEDVTI